ncbi:unnamed protein product [Nippostrongylus brasiliensis]|uniref:Uncharacterized protein n=1 Tax=Nippostrongylus brasiliensis TaxID=27835 RepID=A0A0N4YH62_NIPBR|nr:unnamed protein product [Nippostrongylus brasiliensis]
MHRQGIGAYKIVLLLIYGFCFWLLIKYLLWDYVSRLLFGTYYPREAFEKRDRDLLDEIELNCDEILSGNQSAIQKAKLMQYNPHAVEKLILDADNRCLAIRSLFGFDNKPSSQAEVDYPLAYGLIVYKNLVQILFMLSSFYRPQNEYCIAVSGAAEPMLKLILAEVDSCFDNIRVLNRPRIDWGSFEIINSTFACLEVLSTVETPWKYYQYLSGVDIPLKTNLEMVEIFKKWNNTVNNEIGMYQPQRIRSKRIESAPLPLFKSSLSATLPRAAVDRIVESSEARELLQFLRHTSIPDESFWTTLAGNVEKFPLPGGLDAAQWISYRLQYEKNHKEDLMRFRKEKYAMRYYLSRYQLWDGSRCRGKPFLSLTQNTKARIHNGYQRYIPRTARKLIVVNARCGLDWV